MLVGLVEEMTCKWERQLEDGGGEGSWNDDMLAREGTEGKPIQRQQRSSAVVGEVVIYLKRAGAV